MQRMKTGEGSWVGTSLLGNGLWSCGVDRPGGPGRRLPAASAAARPAALGAGQHLPHLGRSLAAAHHRARGQDVAGRLRDHRPARARRRIRASPRCEDRRKRSRRARHHPERGLRPEATTSIGARPGGATASPSASSAGRRTCPTTSRRWPAAPWSRRRSPRCRARWPTPSVSASPSSRSRSPRRRSASTATRSCAEAGLSRRRDRGSARERCRAMSEPP